jgi:hypothetical protein
MQIPFSPHQGFDFPERMVDNLKGILNNLRIWQGPGLWARPPGPGWQVWSPEEFPHPFQFLEHGQIRVRGFQLMLAGDGRTFERWQLQI